MSRRKDRSFRNVVIQIGISHKHEDDKKNGAGQHGHQKADTEDPVRLLLMEGPKLIDIQDRNPQ